MSKFYTILVICLSSKSILSSSSEYVLWCQHFSAFCSVDIVYSAETCADAWIEKEVCDSTPLITKSDSVFHFINHSGFYEL